MSRSVNELRKNQLTKLFSISFVSGSTSIISWSKAETWEQSEQAWLQTFFKLSSRVFSRTKNRIQIWNNLRASKWHNVRFWVNNRAAVNWPLGRSYPASPSPPPAVWWRCPWRDPSGCASSDGSHTCREAKIRLHFDSANVSSGLAAGATDLYTTSIELESTHFIQTRAVDSQPQFNQLWKKQIK